MVPHSLLLFISIQHIGFVGNSRPGGSVAFRKAARVTKIAISVNMLIEEHAIHSSKAIEITDPRIQADLLWYESRQYNTQIWTLWYSFWYPMSYRERFDAIQMTNSEISCDTLVIVSRCSPVIQARRTNTIMQCRALYGLLHKWDPGRPDRRGTTKLNTHQNNGT